MTALLIISAAALPTPGARGFALMRASSTPAVPLAGPPEAVPLGREIFCNRALNMDKIQAVGFDLDYTLAEYKTEFDLLAYHGAVRKLRQLGYPEEIEEFEFMPGAYQRGLVIDKRRGNLIKLDRHKYAKVAYHGLAEIPSAERKAIYAQSFEQQPQFNPPDYASVDTEFLKVDVCLFCQLVDLMDRQGLPRATYAEVYKDIRNAVDLCHCDGEIKGPVATDPAKYIEASPDLPEMLAQLRRSGKQVFLLTNSLYDYTEVSAPPLRRRPPAPHTHAGPFREWILCRLRSVDRLLARAWGGSMGGGTGCRPVQEASALTDVHRLCPPGAPDFSCPVRDCVACCSGARCCSTGGVHLPPR